MKYIIVLGDGMADEPIQELGGMTPLEYADTPAMDMLAAESEIGLVQTIPEGMSPGSDTANLSVLGYNPREYYTGRSPLEALSIGVDMRPSDVALRCNFVTLSENNEPYEDKIILDHSSGEITTEESDILLQAIKDALQNDTYQFYTGTSYRNLTIWNLGEVISLTPPHDILERQIGEFLPNNAALTEMMKKSYDILNQHPINLAREEKGLNKANSIWFWGAGTKPALDSFEQKNNKRGAMISAVDLLRGIAAGAGMKNIEVEGADGTLNTNYEGKAMAAVNVLLKDDIDFVYVHIEAPDEMGHQGNLQHKIKAIEYIDHLVIRNIMEKMEQSKTDYRMLIMPDHPTPIHCRTHTNNPVPYMLYDSRVKQKNGSTYNEISAVNSGNYREDGYTLINKLFSN